MKQSLVLKKLKWQSVLHQIRDMLVVTTGAVKAIEKMKRGLSDHPQVQLFLNDRMKI